MSIDIVISENVAVTNHEGVILSSLHGGLRVGASTSVGFLEQASHRQEFIELFARELGVSPTQLDHEIQQACWVLEHELIQDAWRGASGPLAREPRTITLSRFLEIADEQALDEVTTIAKRKHTALRRAEFNRVRSDRVLALLDAGASYQCCHPGCSAREGLTLDHIIPLSRGGTDDVGNLQFMCQPHNSQKGVR